MGNQPHQINDCRFRETLPQKMGCSVTEEETQHCPLCPVGHRNTEMSKDSSSQPQIISPRGSSGRDCPEAQETILMLLRLQGEPGRGGEDAKRAI